MRKVILLFITVILSVSMVACNKDNISDKPNASTNTQQQEAVFPEFNNSELIYEEENGFKIYVIKDFVNASLSQTFRLYIDNQSKNTYEITFNNEETMVNGKPISIDFFINKEITSKQSKYMDCIVLKSLLSEAEIDNIEEITLSFNITNKGLKDKTITTDNIVVKF